MTIHSADTAADQLQVEFSKIVLLSFFVVTYHFSGHCFMHNSAMTALTLVSNQQAEITSVFSSLPIILHFIIQPSFL